MAGTAKIKGDRIERETLKEIAKAGLKVERSLLRAQAGQEVDWDLLVEDDLTVEVKARKDGQGFTTLDKWLGDCDLLVVHRNHRKSMVYMSLDLCVHLLHAYYKGRS